MRHTWSVSVLLAVAIIAGYAAGARPVQAQIEPLPFTIGDTVTFTFPGGSYLKATLVGLLAAFVVTIAIAAVELLLAQRRLAGSMQCNDGICDGGVQVGDVSYLGIAFLVAFAAADRKSVV